MSSSEHLRELTEVLQKMMEDPVSAKIGRHEAINKFRELLDSLQDESEAENDVTEEFSKLKHFLFHWFWERRARMFFRLKQRAKEAYVEDLIWSLKRFLKVVESPLNRVKASPWMHRWHDPTLREERLLAGALQFQRRVMANHNESFMSPAYRYARMLIPFSAAKRDGTSPDILSRADAERLAEVGVKAFYAEKETVKSEDSPHSAALDETTKVDASDGPVSVDLPTASAEPPPETPDDESETDTDEERSE